MIYPSDIDKECVPLCNALNALPSITTFESCCGHGDHPYRIFFKTATIWGLGPILRSLSSTAWRVEACWANGNNSIYFMLEGPIGPADMPGGANELAEWIRRDRQ